MIGGTGPRSGPIDRINLAKRIPTHMRDSVRKGGPPAYRLSLPDIDRLPIETILVETLMGTEGRAFEWVGKVVKPNNPGAYSSKKLTPNKRLVYVFWAKGRACKHLWNPESAVFRHVLLPDDPRWKMADIFKFACDHVRALRGGTHPFRPTILYNALGIEPLADDEEFHHVET